jgi:hypothetical protein
MMKERKYPIGIQTFSEMGTYDAPLLEMLHNDRLDDIIS